MRVQGLKSLWKLGGLVLVVLSLALANSSSAKLGLPKSFTDATDSLAPAEPVAPVGVTAPAGPARPAAPSRNASNVFDETGGLQNEISRLDQGNLDTGDLDRIKDDIKEAVADVEQDLDRIDDDLDQADDDLHDLKKDDDVKGSDELAHAEAKLDSLRDTVHALDARRLDVRRRASELVRERDNGHVDTSALLADVRALGRDIAAAQQGVDELDLLVDAVDEKAG